MSGCAFTTRQLVVGYDGVPLIRDITVSVRPGQIVTLIGPNGSGKSTILKSITRQLRLLGGQVYVDSEALDRLSYKDLSTRMAVVLTERMKPELMTCRDIVATGRYPYTGRLGLLSPRDEAMVEEAMEKVQVLEIAGRDFNAISDGQRQRVLLARAICQQPGIIVLDEPTSYLDVRHKLKLLTLLREMAREKGITVIMSLHEIDLAQKISDTVLCVGGDHVIRCGTPEEVFDRETIRSLYAIDEGAFDPLFGSVELPRPEGTPETLVLSAGGTGIPVYRSLQRQGVPFAAGILYRNDVDWHLARELASEVIDEAPFEPIGDEAFRRAMDWVHRARRIIDAGVTVGQTNARMAEVIRAARQREGYEGRGNRQ